MRSIGDESFQATVVSIIDAGPVLSHLPLTPVRVGAEIELIGHLARANPHSKVLHEGGALSKHIAGFRIRVAEIDYKKKLSQNRSPADRAGVLRGLETRTDDNSRSVLTEILSLYNRDGEAI